MGSSTIRKVRKKLTITEEFEIMKLVLDKFLWIGVILLVYGVYQILQKGDLATALYFFIVSIVILLLFMFLIIKEYEVSK